eukprot:CAMPEP_0115072210 /NCGR_PEP_ID=MMETSP0227-20121206/14100_1 /TAXON_ID=89957 /ORGANISM="Polarella glacialis, Strain CCMP 1383" /LENGTH=165 /DNA_ID=CAMNT_0002458925 /DNA_START=86 /DNA_END=584 /DNA_ORIENTATION=-
MSRLRPNLLITGTPGVGKTTFCEALAATTGFSHLEVSKVVKERKLYKEWDDEMDCSIFDEEYPGAGGCLLDFHSSEFVEDHWFDLVVVLRADTSTLYSRLEKRHYSEAKVKQNVEAEIFQTCLEEAREVFEESNVGILELPHDNQEQMEEALRRVQQFIASFEQR